MHFFSLQCTATGNDSDVSPNLSSNASRIGLSPEVKTLLITARRNITFPIHFRLESIVVRTALHRSLLPMRNSFIAIGERLAYFCLWGSNSVHSSVYLNGCTCYVAFFALEMANTANSPTSCCRSRLPSPLPALLFCWERSRKYFQRTLVLENAHVFAKCLIE